ncbi:DUF6624 domain-containing protein [Streptomyces longwoodensis]|uniref:DUF6624 domain-containing protein n=1 Tax=Streptomyces longwoodensis TaxID=68231 RepID=UPI0033A3ADF8
MAQDLTARVQAARTHWRQPACERATLSEDDLTAADYISRIHGQALRRMVATFGWPGQSLVGDAGCRAAVEIALHCDYDPPFQRTLLRMLHAAVTAGEAEPAQWARLFDRCRVRAGTAQVYGTQHWYRPDGQFFPHPIEAPEELAQRRAQVGLAPYEVCVERLRRFHITSTPCPMPLSTARPVLIAERCAA